MVNGAVLDATADDVRIVDLEGRTTLVNTAMLQMAETAFDPEHASVWESAAVIAERTSDPAGYRSAMERLAADPMCEAVDVYQIAESGAWIQRYSGPVRDTENRVVGRVFVSRDVTAERDAHRLKSNLLATAAHDLRTPLTGILGFAELLAMDDLDDTSRRGYVETIRRESLRLRDMMNDFIDLQQIEGGSVRLEPEPVALVESDRAADLGAADCLSKPFSGASLLESVAGLLPPVGGSVLVVDDDDTIRSLVTTTLARDGRQLREAADGIEALTRISESRPDLIILDLEMPHLDGFGVLERLRESADTRKIPVIILTARDVTPAERARLRHQTVALRQKIDYSAEEMRRLVEETLS